MVVSHQNSAIILQPSIAAFDDPAFNITCRIIGRDSARAKTTMTTDRRDAMSYSSSSQVVSKFPAVIASISRKVLRAGAQSPLWRNHSHRFQCGLRQPDFRFIGAFQEQTQRKASAIGHQHQLSALASPGQPYSSAPFLAGTKEPSKKAWAQSSFCFASRLARIARQRFSQTPASSHSRNLRQQVVGEPNSLGKSCHLAPERSTQRIPSSVRRSSARGRPVRLGGGKFGAINFHCSSVSSLPIRAIFRDFSRIFLLEF